MDINGLSVKCCVENRVTSETTPYKPNNLELYYTCVERADAHSENSSHVDYKRMFSKRPVLFWTLMHPRWTWQHRPHTETLIHIDMAQKWCCMVLSIDNAKLVVFFVPNHPVLGGFPVPYIRIHDASWCYVSHCHISAESGTNLWWPSRDFANTCPHWTNAAQPSCWCPPAARQLGNKTGWFEKTWPCPSQPKFDQGIYVFQDSSWVCVKKKGTNSSTKLVIVTIKPCIFWALKIVMIWCCTYDGVSPFWVFFILNFNPLHFPIHFLGVPQPKHESSVPKRLLWWHRCCWTGTHHLLETLQSLHDPAPLRSWNHWYVDLARSKKLIYHMWNPKPRSYINAQLLYIFHDFSGLHKSHSFEMLQDGLERCMAENI